jgi:hypothetical protein
MDDHTKDYAKSSLYQVRENLSLELMATMLSGLKHFYKNVVLCGDLKND